MSSISNKNSYPKPLEYGDIFIQEGFYNRIVTKRVDTICEDNAIIYKYMLHVDTPTTRHHELGWHIFIDGKEVFKAHCHKFMTKGEFKKRLQEELIKHFKQELNIASSVQKE